MEREYNGSIYHLFCGADIDPEHPWYATVSSEAWYWEPSGYDGVAVDSDAYTDEEEAAWAAEAAHDNGDWA